MERTATKVIEASLVVGQGIPDQYGNTPETVFVHAPYSVRGMLTSRTLLLVKRIYLEKGTEFNHDLVNQGILRQFKAEALYREERRQIWDTCFKKGHDDHVRSQAAWDEGYDEPVICSRCGRVEM